MTRSIIALGVVSLCLSRLPAAPESAIRGQITDSGGAVIAHARVLVHWDSSGSTVGLSDNVGIKQDVTVVTDAGGNYSADVPPGFYDVFVSAMSFTPTTTKVRVKQGRLTTFNTKLNVDPLVIKELGDEIPPN